MLLQCQQHTLRGRAALLLQKQRVLQRGCRASSSIQGCRRSLSSTTNNNSDDDNNKEKEEFVCDVIQGPSLLRTTTVARPSPNLLFLPGLRSLPFWTSPDHTKIAYGDPMVTKVVQYLELHAKDIREEYIAGVEAKQLKSDYATSGHADQLHSGDWDWYSYMNKGSVQGEFANNFPTTAGILQELRSDHLLFEGTPFGFSFFSILHGQSSIQAHTAPMNLRLRIHLPLIVPKIVDESDEDVTKHCGIRVGPIVRPWITDKALVLDDAYNHQVWNHTDEKRVILLVDIWHPDIPLSEKQEIVQLFQDARLQGLWKR